MRVVNGWTLFFHPTFLEQVERLAAAAAAGRAKHPDTVVTADTKLLAALRKLTCEVIPADPNRSEYRQGNTLGGGRKHWFRAKFGGQRFRLFFRFDTRSKIIIYAWVNDSTTLRAYGAKTDAYAVFRSMLAAGNPPDEWPALLAGASASDPLARSE